MDGLVGSPIILFMISLLIFRTLTLYYAAPVMIKALSDAFVKMGIPKNRIYTTLEMRMTCGIGKCGKCNIGHKYVCRRSGLFDGGARQHARRVLMDTQTVSFSASYLQFAEYIIEELLMGFSVFIKI